MKKTIKILHVDSNWDVVYIVIQDGMLMKSIVPMKTAVDLLKKVKFDLILSEPQNKAVLTPQTATDHIDYIKDSLNNHCAFYQTQLARVNGAREDEIENAFRGPERYLEGKKLLFLSD
jgi:hypothetical protein